MYMLYLTCRCDLHHVNMKFPGSITVTVCPAGRYGRVRKPQQSQGSHRPCRTLQTRQPYFTRQELQGHQAQQPRLQGWSVKYIAVMSKV